MVCPNGQVKVEIGSLGWGLVQLGEAAHITAQEEQLGGPQDGAGTLEELAQDGTGTPDQGVRGLEETEDGTPDQGVRGVEEAEDGTPDQGIRGLEETRDRTLDQESRGAEDGTPDQSGWPEAEEAQESHDPIQCLTRQLRGARLGPTASAESAVMGQRPMIQELTSEVSSDSESCSSEVSESSCS